MKSRTILAILVFLLLAVGVQSAVVIEMPKNASALERLAAIEVQRYVYLRTGELPVNGSAGKADVRIVIARKDRAVVTASPLKKTAEPLGAEEYLVRTTTANGRKTCWVVGGDGIGTLYGAYRLAEKLGVRFYLHGDVIPDELLKAFPDINDTGKPLFSVRGIQPFHDFPEGPDWWNTDDYLAYIGQLPKMRMNFIGLHCYPEGGAGPEPLVWIGQQGDADDKGRVKFSSTSHWASTPRDGAWGNAAMSTGDFTAGASLLFPRDQYGPDVMGDSLPRPTTPEQNNAVFDRTADMLNTAFTSAHALGVKTCVGTETPLTIPAAVKEHLKSQGKNPDSIEVVREVYQGMFQRISRAYPIDYYWLWTPEGWTWGGNSDADLKATMSDIQAALSALDALKNPFKLATCGWVLGPAQDRKALDKILPKDSPMSCINRTVGHSPVEPSFAGITGRPKWAIPWMENDPVLTAPQPWVGRMRYDAADAKRLGCTGLLGIHWRTKAMAQNVAALADAAWDQSWVPADFNGPEKNLPKDYNGPLGGKIVTYNVTVAGADDVVIYQSVRYDTDGYRLRIPSGTYTVRLQFNEPAYNVSGRRVFGVSVQGAGVVSNLDMFAKTGQNTALDYTSRGVRVVDGVLRIDFSRVVEYPCIAGIVIEGQTNAGKTYTRKINCGGPAHADYEADTTTPNDVSDKRSMPVEAFYVDFARANFGANVATTIGKILAGIDGRGLPEPVGWIGGPGGIAPNKASWATVKDRYAFVDKLAAAGVNVTGAGNMERFNYYLNTYRAMAAMAELGCLRGELDAKAAAVKDSQEPVEQQTLAEGTLAVRIKMARLWEQMMTYELAAVDTPGELGTVANLEQHTRTTRKFITAHDDLLIQARGAALPAEANVSKSFTGAARIIVPTVRTQVAKGEALVIKVIALDKALPQTVEVCWRPLGNGEYRRVAMSNVGRATYEAKLPSAAGSFEYYVDMKISDGGKLVWPASAPRISQTVVVW